MPCERITLSNGGYGYLRLNREATRRQPCSICRRPASRRCDYPTAQGRTCDAWLCTRCALPLDRDTDWCPGHALEGHPRPEPAPAPAPEPPVPAAPSAVQLGLFGG